MNDVQIRFGKRLREIRLKKGVSQEALAADADLHRTYVSSVERGERNITLLSIYRLAAALSIKPSELLTVLSINSWKREVIIQLDRKSSGKSNRQFGSQTVQLTFDQLKKAEVQLSYAATSHKAQGQTFERAYVLLGGPMTSKELVYVQSTRAKEFTKFFVDRANAGKEYEQIQKEIAISRMKDLAHDISKISR